MSNDQENLALEPEISDFTFSAITAPNVATPNFEPRPLFYYNTPKAEKNQRCWTSEGHQLQMRETVTAPEEDPVSTPAEVARRLIARPRARKTLDVHGSKEAGEKNAERLAKENTFLTEQLKRERARLQTLKEDLKEEQITKQAALNQLQKKADDAEEKAKKYESAFDGQRETVARQEKQIKIIRQNHDIFLREVEQKMAEDNPKIEQQEVAIKGLQRQNEALQKIVEDVPKIEQQEIAIQELQVENDALQKKVVDNPKIELQKVQIKELQSKNKALKEMIENQQKVFEEDLKIAVDSLTKEKEALHTECDALNASLEEATKYSRNASIAARHAQTDIQNRDRTIYELENQIEHNEQRIHAFERERQSKDARIKEKEAALKVAHTEAGNLNTLNVQLNQDNSRLKSQNEKLAKIVQEDHAEIEQLRTENEDLKDIEGKLAAAVTGAAQIKAELLSMEQINRRLKLKILESRRPFLRTGKSDNLDHELSGSDFESLSSDEETATREVLESPGFIVPTSSSNTPQGDTFSSENRPEIIASREILDKAKSQEVITPQDATGHASIITTLGGKASASSTISRDFAYTSKGKEPKSATKLTQTPVVTVATTAPQFSTHQELTQTPVITLASIIPDDTTSLKLAQTSAKTVASITPEVIAHQELIRTPAITVASINSDFTSHQELTQTSVITTASITPKATIPPDFKLSPVTTVATVTPVENLPAIIMKHHNPLGCWLQVYRDLWILFLFWFNHYLDHAYHGTAVVSSSRDVLPENSHISQNTLSSSNDREDDGVGTTPAENEPTGATYQLTSPPNEVSTATSSTDPTSMERGKVKTGPSDFRTTILAFLFHVLFYAFAIICISNYGSILRERSIWLQANDITRQYFQDIYKIPFQPDSNIYRQLFDQIEFFDLLRYYIHIWLNISRSLPG